MLAIIGSHAMNYWVNPEHQRIPNDFDIIGREQEINEFVSYLKKTEKLRSYYPVEKGTKFLIKTDKSIIEAEIAWPNSNSEKLYQFIHQEDVKSTINGFDMLICPLNMLYTLKMSHRYLKNSPHFLKTMRDIHLARAYGAIIPKEYDEFYKERQRIQYDYPAPKLNQSKDTFFSGDGVEYQYDHDTIHEALKFMDKPAYTYYADGEVWSSKEKFHASSEDVKLFGVLEESLVLACERSQLFFTPAPEARWSFEHALFKVCTSITSGFFREYAWENYDKVIALYDKVGQNYVARAKQAIENGVIRSLTPTLAKS